MRRTLGLMILVAVLAGCVSVPHTATRLDSASEVAGEAARADRQVAVQIERYWAVQWDALSRIQEGVGSEHQKASGMRRRARKEDG